MNRNDLIESMAKEAELKKSEAENALRGMLDAVSGALKAGDTITLTGFGTFSVTNRAARVGHNPQSGEKIKIPAKKVIKFKAGKNLSEEIN
jgi:DNA-binding protein HU-beta